jgi:hypothetical protein
MTMPTLPPRSTSLCAVAVSYSGKRVATDRIRPGDAVGRVADCVSRLDVFLELDRKHLPAGQVHAYRHLRHADRNHCVGKAGAEEGGKSDGRDQKGNRRTERA